MSKATAPSDHGLKPSNFSETLSIITICCLPNSDHHASISATNTTSSRRKIREAFKFQDRAEMRYNALKTKLQASSLDGWRSRQRGSSQKSCLLALHIHHLLLPVHLNDQRHNQNQERRAGDPRRFPSAPQQLLAKPGSVERRPARLLRDTGTRHIETHASTPSLPCACARTRTRTGLRNCSAWGRHR